MAQKKPALTLTVAEGDAIIRERLITKTGMSTRETWQKKVMQRYAAFSASLLSDIKGLEDCDKAFDSLLDALKFMVLPVQKTFLGIKASRRDEEVACALQRKTLQEIADVRTIDE
jgi:hypothetical protein